MWKWTIELHELGFRHRSRRYWQCTGRFTLPENAHISLFVDSELMVLGGLEAVEFAAFHVTFEIGRENIHYYYHESSDGEWEPGGYTSANEVRRLGEEPRALRDHADRIAAALVEAWTAALRQRRRR